MNAVEPTDRINFGVLLIDQMGSAACIVDAVATTLPFLKHVYIIVYLFMCVNHIYTSVVSGSDTEPLNSGRW